MPRKKRRLLVGEGDMNFAVSYLQKHPDCSESIVATEYESEKSLKSRPIFVENYNTLHTRKVAMHFGIDARKLNQYKKIPGRFERVHFNFPYVRKDWKSGDVNKQLLRGFFRSVKGMQYLGDRVHITLPKYGKGKAEQEVFRSCVIHGVYDAAAKNGYRLRKRLKFNHKRYPGYQHNQTGTSESLSLAQQAIEQVYEKVSETEPVMYPRSKCFYGQTYQIPQVTTEAEGASSEGEFMILSQSMKRYLKDKNHVAEKAQAYISEGYIDEVSEVLTRGEVYSQYWDIDGGYIAMSKLGNAFSRKHADFMSTWLKKDFSWRSDKIYAALRVLIALVTSTETIISVLSVIHTFRQQNMSYKNGCLELLSGLKINKNHHLYLDWCLNGVKDLSVNTNFVKVWGQYNNVLIELKERIDLLGLTGLNWEDVVKGSVCSDEQKAFLYQVLIQVPTFEKWLPVYFSQVREQLKGVLLSGLKSKPHVYLLTEMLIRLELVSKEEIGQLLLEARLLATDRYWDIGSLGGKGGIHAMGLLGAAFTSQHADYFIERIHGDESFRDTSIKWALDQLSSCEESTTEILRVANEFRLSHYEPKGMLALFGLFKTATAGSSARELQETTLGLSLYG